MVKSTLVKQRISETGGDNIGMITKIEEHVA